MRSNFDSKIEAGRIVAGAFASRRGDTFGAFNVPGPCGRALRIICDDGRGDPPGWEHVSVSIDGKNPPNWQEMNWVKEKFWAEDETVLQFHPRRSEYVNCHPNCLHLWRQVGVDHPLPPRVLV